MTAAIANPTAREFLRNADPILARVIDAHPGFRPRAWIDELPALDAFWTLTFQVAGQRCGPVQVARHQPDHEELQQARHRHDPVGLAEPRPTLDRRELEGPLRPVAGQSPVGAVAEPGLLLDRRGQHCGERDGDLLRRDRRMGGNGGRQISGLRQPSQSLPPCRDRGRAILRPNPMLAIHAPQCLHFGLSLKLQV